MVGLRNKFLGIGMVKTVKSGPFSMTSRTFQLDESLKTTLIFFYSQTHMFIFIYKQA